MYFSHMYTRSKFYKCVTLRGALQRLREPSTGPQDDRHYMDGRPFDSLFDPGSIDFLVGTGLIESVT